MKKIEILVMVLAIGIFNTTALEATPYTWEINGELYLQNGEDRFPIGGEVVTLRFTAGDTPYFTDLSEGEHSQAWFYLTDISLTIGTNTYNTIDSPSNNIRFHNYFTTNTIVGADSDRIRIYIRTLEIPDNSNTLQFVEMEGQVIFNSLDFWTDSEDPPTYKPFDGSVVDSTIFDIGELDDHMWVYRFRNTEISISPVPEPATFLLIGTGLLGLAAFSRRKIERLK